MNTPPRSLERLISLVQTWIRRDCEEIPRDLVYYIKHRRRYDTCGTAVLGAQCLVEK
jgi:hypothetical protein